MAAEAAHAAVAVVPRPSHEEDWKKKKVSVSAFPLSALTISASVVVSLSVFAGPGALGDGLAKLLRGGVLDMVLVF